MMEENLFWRKHRHPDLTVSPSAGSIFQKIEGIGAGRLIDQCGLKGHTEGVPRSSEPRQHHHQSGGRDRFGHRA